MLDFHYISNLSFIRFCWYFAYIRTFIDYIVFFWLVDTNVSRQALNKQSINYLYSYLSLVKLKNVVLDEKPLSFCFFSQNTCSDRPVERILWYRMTFLIAMFCLAI